MVPYGVQEIPNSCFQEAGCLEQVELPTTCTVLNIGAFAHCSNLRTINTGYVKSFMSMCFESCSSLTYVEIAADAQIAEDAFAGCPAHD